MTPDLDSLATALYVKTDDLLKASPQLAPYRPEAGIAPQLSDAELGRVGGRLHAIKHRALQRQSP